MPQGTLTPVQHEILEAVWGCGPAGATVAEVWQVISASRPIGRTTVLNLMNRLCKRGWLVRRQDQGTYRYAAGADRNATSSLLAAGFVDDFFGGSAKNLVASLLGSERLQPDEVERLRALLQSIPSGEPKQARSTS